MGIGSSSSLQQISINGRFRRFLSLAIFLTLALGVGCRGFFVNPKLTSITVTPSTVTISKGQTKQMTATGNYDDGSTKNLSGSATWTSSDSTCATVSGSGLVTAANVTATCTATITAMSGSFTSTGATVNVTPGALVSIALTVNNGLTVTVPAGTGTTVTFKALGTYSGSSTQQDITTQVTWTISNTVVLPSISGNGSGTTSSSATSGSSTTVTASLSSITSNQVTIKVQ